MPRKTPFSSNPYLTLALFLNEIAWPFGKLRGSFFLPGFALQKK
jgi:hypothetical protein